MIGSLLGPWGSLAGAAFGVVGNIVGASGAKKARDKQMNLINESDRRNDQWYKQNYYTNQLDRTENYNALKRAQEFIQDRSKIARKTAAITGATPESVAASQKADMHSYANLTNQIAAGASATRDRIHSMYEANKQRIEDQRNALLNNQVEQYGNMSANAGMLGVNSAMSLMGQLYNKHMKDAWNANPLKNPPYPVYKDPGKGFQNMLPEIILSPPKG